MSISVFLTLIAGGVLVVAGMCIGAWLARR